jgi:multidrug efflux system membrane fusion protein
VKRLTPALLCLLLAACGEAPPPALPPPIVLTLVAGATDGQSAHTYSGEVHARYEMPLAFRIGGKLLERKVDAGARVRAGELLARLDPADVALQSAQADAQRALAEADVRRYRDLYAKKFVSAAALDAKETAYRAAAAQAGIARNQAAYADLRADSAGVVAAVLAEPGQVVAAGQPVFRLARDGEREAAIDLPETVVDGLAPGAEAEVMLWADGKRYHGRVRELSPAADPATRTFAARVTILDADDAVGLGMTARVRFVRPGDAAITVPVAAVFQQDGSPGAAVWVVGKDDSLALRPVSVGAYTDAGATITGGLNPGERIVAAGVHKLVAGEKVRIAADGR